LNVLIRDSRDGIMIPLPQYPLYSATLTLLGGHKIDYELDETAEWGVSRDKLQASVDNAVDHGITPRAMAVINPGNPTGQVLSLENMQMIVELCKKNGLLLMADEVYQTNIYGDKPFYSFKQVAHDMGEEYRNGGFELVSFHSTSKGFAGECGFRGGYMEMYGIDEAVIDEVYKLVSVSLCPNLPGQIMTELMVNPPAEGEESYALYQKEKSDILVSLAKRARNLAEAFNKMEGVTCNPSEGAMYLFPRITLSPNAVSASEEAGMPPDTFYAVQLLEATGICVVPGCGFGQEAGTFHFRTTFLPPDHKMNKVVELMATFHADFMAKYAMSSRM
jgi:aspartate/methionine/tyrosine aminotransferase